MRKTADIVELRARKALGRPKVRSDEEQMDIIVGKAIEIFLDVGFGAMRMDDVAAACRASKRTLYRLFPSKLDLFRSMVAVHRQSMLIFPPIDDQQTLEEALAEVFRIDIDAEEDCRRMAFIHRAVAETRAVPELGDILHDEGGEKAKGLLGAWLAVWKDRGAARIGDPYAAASILMDMVFGAIALKPSDVSYWPGGSDRRAYLRECFRYFVNGVK
jgi:AcrR family transcriptional regulator